MLTSRSIRLTQVCSVRCEPPSCQRPVRALASLTLESRRHRHCGSLPELWPANCHASTTSSPLLLMPMMCGTIRDGGPHRYKPPAALRGWRCGRGCRWRWALLPWSLTISVSSTIRSRERHDFEHIASYAFHTICSVQPSSLNSCVRKFASSFAKNSSSCGGLMAVPASMQWACPR